MELQNEVLRRRILLYFSGKIRLARYLLIFFYECLASSFTYGDGSNEIKKKRVIFDYLCFRYILCDAHE